MTARSDKIMVPSIPPPNSDPPQSLPARQAARAVIHWPRRPVRRILFVGVYLLFCWGLLFLGAKMFWWWRAGVPFDQTADIWDSYYPELRRSQVRETHPRHNDDRFDLLLLGGSVLEPAWGDIEKRLTEKLQSEVGDHFRIYNLGHAAHTSRDSLLKYSHLPDEQFELVIVYDGINDVRLNCCPRALFRDDYRHFAWYNSFQKRLAAGSMSLPAWLVDEAQLLNETLEFNAENEAMLEEGRDVKTVRPLQRNLEEILGTAAVRGDTMLLTTFAYHIPEEYSRERFESGMLKYGDPKGRRPCAAELWGKPAYVIAAIDAQNAAIRTLAAEHRDAFFVDQRAQMPEDGTLFIDPCHLTDEGCRKFVDNLWPAVKRRIAVWKGSRTLTGPDDRRESH